VSEFVDNHPLSRDFPEHKQHITTLKASNAHFTKLMAEYEVMDKEIVRVEQGLEYKDDLELDGLKMKRVQLKDELYNMLETLNS
jgi:uncharacterized protein YdcH (DUF465 family)